MSSVATMARLDVNVKRADLLHALQRCLLVARASQVIPIVANVKLVAESDVLRVVATDLDAAVRAIVPAEIGHPGATTVDAKGLRDAVKSGEADDVALCLDVDTARLQIQCGSASFVLPTIPAEDFPAEPDTSDGEVVMFDRALLQSAVKAAGYCTCEEETRWQLQGAMLSVERKTFEVCATDGHRLALVTGSLSEPASVRALLPRSLVRAVDDLTSETVELHVGLNHVTLFDGDVVVSARAVDVNFPNYRSAIKKPGGHILIDRSRMLAALRRVITFASKESRATALSFSRAKLTVKAFAVSVGTEATDSFAIDYDGPDLRVGVNGGYLIQALEAMTTDRVAVAVEGEEVQIQIEPDQETGASLEQLHLVMPMRLEWKER